MRIKSIPFSSLFEFLKKAKVRERERQTERERERQRQRQRQRRMTQKFYHDTFVEHSQLTHYVIFDISVIVRRLPTLSEHKASIKTQAPLQ